MADITAEEIYRLFKTLVPEAEIYVVPHNRYIQQALYSPFILEQIRAGIYNAFNIYTDFLSVARTFSEEKVIELDLELLVGHMKGVDHDVAAAYCSQIALHERHHLLNHASPTADEDLNTQWDREQECNTFLEENYGTMMAKAKLVYEQSAPMRRVAERMSLLLQES